MVDPHTERESTRNILFPSLLSQRKVESKCTGTSKHGAERPQKPQGLLGTGKWGVGMEVAVREIIYLSLHCHYQNDSCIKMGSDKSHFNVSLIVKDKVTNKTVSTDHNF